MFIIDQGNPDLAIATLMPILLLMCYVSLKLTRIRKNKAYGFLLIGFALSLAAAFTSLLIGYWQPMLGANMAGAALIIYGLFILHKRAYKFMHYIISLSSVGMIVLQVYLEPWVCLTLVALIGAVMAAIIYRKLPNASSSFHMAMLLMTASSCSLLFAIYSHKPWAAPTGYWLSVAVYLLLFMVLFNRVVHIMQSSYVSSITDSLTGLYNRKYFISYLRKCITAGAPVAVLFSDIDNFKKLNDTMGHKAGDEALQIVAGIMREEVERIGIAGRYGGEEMVVCITDPEVSIRSFAENLRRRIESETEVTASIGYTVADHRLAPEEIVKCADTAMYQAKQTGKNKVISFKELKGMA